MKVSEIIFGILVGIPMIGMMLAFTAIFLKQMWVVFKDTK